MAPKGSGMAPKGSGMAPKGSGMAPKGSGMAPKGSGMAPKGTRTGRTSTISTTADGRGGDPRRAYVIETTRLDR
jgi:AP-1 complex subunit sigma 1/2